MTFTPYGVEMGPLTFWYFGITLAVGAAAASATTSILMRNGIPWASDANRWVPDAILWTLVPALLGARLFHVFLPSQSSLAAGVNPAFYLSHPFEILNFWEGGLGLPGALAGGAAGLYLYSRWIGFPFLTLLDSVAPGVVVGQIFIRVGLLFTQQGYGPPTEVPWKQYIRPENRLPGFEDINFFHPLPAYGAVWDLVTIGFLIWISINWKSCLKQGDLFWLYLLTFSFERFVAGFWHPDLASVLHGNLEHAILACLLVSSAGIIIYTRASEFASCIRRKS